MLVNLKSEDGQLLASGSIGASSQCLQLAQGSAWVDQQCRDWGYTEFSGNVELIEGSRYSVEFSASAGAGYKFSTVEPLSVYHSFDNRNNWKDARGEISTNAGQTWVEWADRLANDRDMTVLFTIEGMPRQMP